VFIVGDIAFVLACSGGKRPAGQVSTGRPRR